MDDIEGSGQDPWCTGSSLISWIIFIDPIQVLYSVSGQYLNLFLFLFHLSLTSEVLYIGERLTTRH